MNSLENGAEATGAGKVLVFSLNGEHYAVPLSKVKEVIGFTETTPVPHTPSYFKGIINLRGQVISVLDLRLALKMSKADTGAETAIVILDFTSLQLGVIVDSVDSVQTLLAEEISPPPALENHVKSDHLIGVARKEGQLILLLNIEGAVHFQDLKIPPATKAA